MSELKLIELDKAVADLDELINKEVEHRNEINPAMNGIVYGRLDERIRALRRARGMLLSDTPPATGEAIEATFTYHFLTLSPKEQRTTLETLGDLAGLFVNILEEGGE